MKKSVILILSMLFPVLVFAQIRTEKVFFDSNGQNCDSASAKTISTYYYTDTISDKGKIITQNKTGQVKSICEYSDLKLKTRNGMSSVFYENGAPKSKSTYKDGYIEGELTTYYLSGQLKRRDYYENGTLRSGNCYSSSGQDTAYFLYEIMPQYPGGQEAMVKFLSTNVKYPKKARKKGIEGQVAVKFTIDENGLVINAIITKSVDPLIDEEALRVINAMPKWTPGMQDGESVPVMFMLPIRFYLK